MDAILLEYKIDTSIFNILPKYLLIFYDRKSHLPYVSKVIKVIEITIVKREWANFVTTIFLGFDISRIFDTMYISFTYHLLLPFFSFRYSSFIATQTRTAIILRLPPPLSLSLSLSLSVRLSLSRNTISNNACYANLLPSLQISRDARA